MSKSIPKKKLVAFGRSLREAERAPATVEKYLRDAEAFARFVGEEKLTRERVLKFKESLGRTRSTAGANAVLAAVNALLRFLGRADLTVRPFRIQKQVFCPEEKELSRAEYLRLVRAAREAHNPRLALLLETVCGTGIRISELPFVTVEAARKGEATVTCKAKTRTVFLVAALTKKLLKYAKREGITAGPVFVTNSGRPLDRSNVWREMKRLCAAAKVHPAKVFPHNLRHLFARTFYGIDKDIAKLADLLGHSSVNTTRIYLVHTGAEHRRRMEAMHLIS